MSDNNKNNKNISDIDDMDQDDPNSPFKSNHTDMTTLSNETEIKTINRRSHSKSLFKSIFCCFSTSIHRNHANKASNSQTAKTKKNSFINSTSFDSQLNNNNNNNNNSNATNNDSNLINQSDNTSTDNKNNSQINTNLTNVNNNNNNNNNNNDIDSNNSNHVSTTTNININNNTNNNDNSNGFQTNCNNNNYYPSYRDSYHQQERFLLPSINPVDNGKKCLIIDLDETLVHSSFKQVNNPDFIVPVEIDGIIHQVYVLKRPFVDDFLKRMGQLYECVLFTASLAKYADPVADLLDKWGVFRYRLFREACVYYRGNYVKDLSRLGRDLNKVIILDNSPASYIFHPNNAVPCISWFDDMNDTELTDLIPHFERLSAVDSVYSILKQSNTNSISNNMLHQHHHQQQLQQQHQSYTSTSDYNDHNQQVPIIQQNQSIIYQVNQNTVNSISNTNNNTEEINISQQTTNATASNSYNYLLNENKILLSIDLMMATKQKQQDNNDNEINK